MAKATCSIDGCDKPMLCRTWCGMHYARWRTHGDPLKVIPHPGKSVCLIADCGREHLSRGWCSLHYGRWKKYGDPLAEPPVKLKPKCLVDGCLRDGTGGQGWCGLHHGRWKRQGDPLTVRTRAGECSIEGCAKPGNGGWGWCETHYRRYQRHGDPLATSRIVGNDGARFWSYVDKNGPVPDYRPDLGPCWLWTGGLSPDGYAILLVKSGTNYMARWSYGRFVAPVPQDHQIDHLCRVRACVNYERHLEPVTSEENVRRARAAMRGLDVAPIRLAAAKGRTRLTADQVREIRRRYHESPVLQADLARAYGVNATTISTIIRRTAWVHVPD